MIVAYAAAVVVATYLYAGTNMALILTRAAKGIDIRSVGSGGAGTANVGRTLGKGYALLVFLFDLSKSLLPLILSRRFLFPGPDWTHTAALFAVAMAAVLGHCRPIFHGFRGGGGVVTSMGAFFFFVPLEFFLSMLSGFLFVQIFLRKAEYRFGQWTPILFLAITPVVTFLSSALVDVGVFAGIRFGGKPWYVSAGVLALGLLILLLNPAKALSRAREARRLAADRQPASGRPSDPEE